MSIFFAKDFKYKEIMCPCGCEKIKPIDPTLSFLLQSLREKINKPIYITSGIRCKGYNRKIGGYIRSPHVPYWVKIKGTKYLIGCRAVDIHAKKTKIIDLAITAKSIGFSRIGLYPYNHFCHVDTVRPYRNASWVRDKRGKYTYFKTLEKAIEYCYLIDLR